MVLNEFPQFPTLLDWAKRLDPNGRVDAIVQLLSQSNPILQDMMWVEGNLPTGHKTTIQTGLPAVAWRKLYEGVQPSKSTTAQIVDTCGMLEGYALVDKALADLNGNTAAFRLSETKSFMEALSQRMAKTMIYGNATAEPAAFTGFALRYSELPGANSAPSSQNVLNAGGAAGEDLTSVYLFGYGSDAIHGIFPKGSRAGITHQDLGEVTADAATGGQFQAYRDHFRWDAGLTVRDWRYGARVANVSVKDLENLNGSQALDAKTSIIKQMIRAIDRFPNLETVRPVFYVNRTVYSLFKIAAMEKTIKVLAIEAGVNQFSGGVRRSELTFDGIPVRKVDAIVNTEELVTAAP